jgi:hypothetical protein
MDLQVSTMMTKKFQSVLYASVPNEVTSIADRHRQCNDLWVRAVLVSCRFARS